MSKNIMIGGGIAVVLLLALVFAFSGGDSSSDGVAFGDVTVQGQPLVQFDSGPEDPALGQPGPVLSGVDESGDPVTIGGPGEPRIVLFLAHWCSHCQAEAPRVTDYLNNNDVNVQFQAVATGSEPTAPNYPPSDWLDLVGWPVETMYDDQADTAATAYGLSGFPYWVVLDADGVVQARFSGELDETQLASVIDFAGTLGG